MVSERISRLSLRAGSVSSPKRRSFARNCAGLNVEWLISWFLLLPVFVLVVSCVARVADLESRLSAFEINDAPVAAAASSTADPFDAIWGEPSSSTAASGPRPDSPFLEPEVWLLCSCFVSLCLTRRTLSTLRPSLRRHRILLSPLTELACCVLVISLVSLAESWYFVSLCFLKRTEVRAYLMWLLFGSVETQSSGRRACVGAVRILVRL